jgi:thiol-disulfide isomerase/thioredoxin
MATDLYAPRLQCLLTAFGLVAAAAILAGCGQKEEGPVTAASGKFEVADDTAPATGSTAASSEVSSAGAGETAASDPAMPGGLVGDVPTPPITPPIDGAVGGAKGYQVPEGKEALLAFLKQLQRQQPKGQTQQELLDDFRAMHSARIQAADKLLKESQEKQDRMAATQAKLDAMRALSRLGDRQAEKELNRYARTVSQDSDLEIANLGRLMLFGMSLETLGSGEMTDVQPLVAELKKLIADQPNAPGVFMLARQAAVMLQQLGQKDAAAEAYQTIGNAYKDSQDPQIAAEVRSMLEQAQVQAQENELDLDGKLRALLTGQPNSAQPVLEVLKALLGGEAPGEYALNVVSQVAQLLEISGNYKEATEAFTLLESKYKDHPNQELAKQASARAENGRRRSALVGQPFTVEGVQVDGSPFDWGKYQGKVVLVDFWATWCGPCLQEIPNIDANYKKYKDKGFEVVGVNLDDDSQTVVRFLEVQPLPWATVVSADPNARGFEHPLAIQCGIDAIPFIVLVDRDGKVNALHVRGEKLEQKLAELLGPAGEPAATTPAAPAPPAAPAAPPEQPAAAQPKADS